MKIVFYEIEDWEEGVLRENLSEHECVFHHDALGLENAEDADIVSVFVYSEISDDVLKKIPSVKLVTTRSMGYDHINIDACKERGIAIARVPEYGVHTVAEHTFALILALSRKIFLAYERTEKHIFDYHGLQGIDLYKKTLGLVGGGRIGQHVAKIARGFEMNVVVADPYPNERIAKELGFRYVELDELYAQSDVISLHAPLLPETEHMLNSEAIAKMKDGVLLVNTARGALIDTAALLKGLESGKVAGAGLDVVEGECDLKEERELMGKDFPNKCDLGALLRNHMLIARDDVLITPHIGFNSREAVERIVHTTIENINGFVAGTPVNTVD